MFFTNHYSPPEEFSPLRAPRWKRFAARVINYPIRGIVCPSEFGRSCLIGTDLMPEERFRRIYNATDLDRAAANEERGRLFRERHRIPSERRLIAQIGTLASEKGVFDLLHAARIVISREPTAHFVLAGDGPDEDACRRTAEDLGIARRVTFTGLVDDIFGSGLYEATEIVCLVSRWQELFGFVLIEAMAARSVGHVRCELQNYGDVMVYQAIKEMLGDLTLITYSGNSWKMRLFDRVFGVSRLFKYCSLGGGTLIFAPRRAGWLGTLEHLVKKTTPLFSFGTGVIDPEFIRHLKLPFRQETADDWIRCLGKFRFLSVRGVESLRILREHGLDSAEVIGDAALHYARPAYSEKKRQKRIGINVTNYSYSWNNSQHTSIQQMVQVIKWLVQNDWQVTIFPAMHEDAESARDVLRETGATDIRVYDNYLDVGAYLDRIEALDLFLGFRLHTVIAACCVCTPAIMIEYQPKCHDFMKTMGLVKYSFRADRLCADELVATIEQMYDKAHVIQGEQFAACHLYRGKLAAFRAKVFDFMANDR